jgi:sulfur relay (sulfurtransferase) DsrF/TusC family protein
MDKINQFNDYIVLLKDNMATNLNNINELNLLYKDFIKFIKILSIYEINKWQLLKNKYNELKIKIKNDKSLYNKIIRLYETIYTYFENSEIDCNNNKINNLKQLIDNNIFYLYNLQKEHRFISCKLLNITKDNRIYKTNIINHLIKDNIMNHYDKIIMMKKYNNDYKNIKNKIKYNTDYNGHC